MKQQINTFVANADGRKTNAGIAAIAIYVVGSNILGMEPDPNILVLLGGFTGIAARQGLKKRPA